MERPEIIKLSKRNIEIEELEKAKKILEKDYYIAYGNYEPLELKKAINEESPVIIKDNFLIGYDKGNIFVNSNREKITIDKMVKAIIVEGPIEQAADSGPGGDPFAILGKNEWEDISGYYSVFGSLRVGAVFLPPHSAIFNFLMPGKEQEKKKIVSMLSGVNIVVYSPVNYIDNCIHEIGHLFWRDCVNFEEKKALKAHFNLLRPSAIYEYEWERETEEEVFCTVYKWYVKSILLNKSFYNILEFEEPKGLKLLQDILSRVARDRQISDIWGGAKAEIAEYLNPKFDVTSGKYLRKAGALDRIRDVELPSEVLQNIDRYEGGVEYIRLEKAVVPVKGNKIDWENMGFSKMEKAKERPFVYVDIDGVIADFAKGYKDMFFRDVYGDDPFTVKQFVLTVPYFFRVLPVLEKGRELVDLLKDDYEIIFLTTPMAEIESCRRDKLEWVREHFGPGHDVLFSDNKAEFVMDEKSILIDDMEYNLKPWRDSGGTAINIRERNDAIIEKIENALSGKEAERVKKELASMDVETEPSEKQKESGNYKKGRITFKGLSVVIENPKGSWRFGKGWNEQDKWASKMKAHYGYIVNDGGQETADGDKVDCFIGPKTGASRVFIVNQFKDGMFDEHKVILGAENVDEAREIYLSNYPKGWNGLESIHQLNTKKLREWLKNGNLNEPFNSD